MTLDVRAAVDAVHRQSWGRVLAAAARIANGDLHLAEEACQEAFVSALRTWPDRGVPDNPVAWLSQAARRKVIDRLRQEDTIRRRLPLLASDDGPEEEVDAVAVDFDDRLRLVFTCCHPALAAEARVALTLRMVCGLTTAEIARAFLVSEPTMAARVTRAKKKIAAAGIPYRVPADHDLPDRLDGVLSVVHLVFTTGHVAPVRPDLVERALDLARVLAALMPDEPEVLGLLALLLLTDARRDARTDADGRLVLLPDQDRSRWDWTAIEQGGQLLERAARRVTAPGRFLIQASIAAAHSARTAEETDWRAILAGYDRLLAAWPSPVVALNRTVAVSYVRGPEAALADLDTLADDPRLSRYHYLPATRADFLRRLGRLTEAAQAYEAALALEPAEAEAAFLRERLMSVRSTF
ncbi:RNA polymerase sigma factor [Fodinicola acaciae]|uniref:RNA polymerase sigma factor n=1 Tax=Fodinicola acaciae TaxID=2681555 RepID=UPI001C9E34AB|nr:sigma-70 family RNA polymerase sigma factor [Fodinicola acaciae]